VCVGPLVLEGADEPFGFAVPARRVDRSEDVAGAGGREQFGEAAAVSVDHRVVSHDRFGRVETELREEAERTLERAQVCLSVLARVELDVGDPAVVVDYAVQMVVADPTVEILRRAVAGNAMAGDAEAGELFDVHVQEGSWPRPFVAAIALPLLTRSA